MKIMSCILSLIVCAMPLHANEFVVKKQKIKEKKSTLEQACLEEIGAIFELSLELSRLAARDTSAVASKVRLSIVDVQEQCMRILRSCFEDGSCALLNGKDKHQLQQLGQQLKAWRQELSAVRILNEPQLLSSLHTSLQKEKKLLRV